jgi:hypothetical protein
LTFFAPELIAKRLELLKEIVPSMTQAGVLLHRNLPAADAGVGKSWSNSICWRAGGSEI